MLEVKVTELRSHLQEYLASVQRGSEILVTSHGKVIARIIPPTNVKTEAILKLKELRKHCKIGDVLSPIDESWDAEK